MKIKTIFRILEILIGIGLSVDCIVRSDLATAGSFSAEVDRTEIDMGESVTLSITVEGKAKGKPSLPKIPDVTIEERGSHTQISSSFGGGGGLAVVQQQIMSFELMPEKAGNVSVPSLSLEVDGEVLKTLPIEIKVRAASGGASQNGANGRPEPRELALEREVPRRNLYVGEALPVTVRVVSRVDLREKQLDQPLSPDWRVVPRGAERVLDSSRGGQSIRQWELQQVWVPGRSGPLHVDAAKLTGVFLARSGGFFDMVRPVKRVVQSEALDFEVEPLPPGEPAEFSGLVGHFVLQGTLDTQKVRVGDNVPLKITLQGTGLIEGWDAERELKLAKGHESEFKFYSGKPKLETLQDGDILQRKEFELALIPLRAGTIKLAPLSVTFFNPVTKKYEVSAVDLPPLTVEESVGGSPRAGANLSHSVGNGALEGDMGNCPPVAKGAQGSTGGDSGLAILAAATPADKGTLQPERLGDRLQSIFFRYGTWILISCQILLAIPLAVQFPLGCRRLAAKLSSLKVTGRGRHLSEWSKMKRQLDQLGGTEILRSQDRQRLEELMTATGRFAKELAVEHDGQGKELTQELGQLRAVLEREQFGGLSLRNQDVIPAVNAVVANWPQTLAKTKSKTSVASTGVLGVILVGLFSCLGQGTMAQSGAEESVPLNWQGKSEEILKSIETRQVSAFKFSKLEILMTQMGQLHGAMLARELAEHLAGIGRLELKSVETRGVLRLSRSFRPDTLLLVSIFGSVIVCVFYWLQRTKVASLAFRVCGLASWCLAAGFSTLSLIRLGNPIIVGIPMGDTVDVGLVSDVNGSDLKALFSVAGTDIVTKLKENNGYCQVQAPTGQIGWTPCEKFTFLPSL